MLLDQQKVQEIEAYYKKCFEVGPHIVHFDEKALGKYLVNYEYHPIFVEATAEEIDPIYKGVRSAFTAQVKIPGFRPGKAPWAQVEKLYSKNIQEEIITKRAKAN